MKTWAAKGFWVIAGVLLCGALLSELLLYSQNTLINNGNWVATKRKLVMAVMGADEFLITRPTLAGNSLNLGAWYGYQKVLLKNPKIFKQIEFNFKIPDESFLDVILNKTDQGFSGIRLSRAGVYPSIFFQSDMEGRFTATRPISVGSLPAGWHRAALGFGDEGIYFEMDHGRHLLIDSNRLSANQLGFRAGYAGAKIDDIVAQNTDGSFFRESFRNKKNWFELAVLHSTLAAMLFGAIFLFLFKIVRWQETRSINTLLVMLLQALLCLSAFYSFDFLFWSEKPFQPDMRLLANGAPVPLLGFEQFRFDFFKAWDNALGGARDPREALLLEYPMHRIYKGPIFCTSSGEKCSEAYIAKKNTKCFHFVLVGTSQSIGAGASTLDETFFVRIHKGLQKILQGRCVESLNLSISGSNLTEMTDVFRNYREFRPDLVVVNLSNNDPADGFYERLRQFAHITQETHAKLVFVAEAISVDEGNGEQVAGKHEIMRRAGADLGIETISIQEFLGKDEIRQSGQIWWDYAHLSSYGQRLFAEWFLPKVPDLLKYDGGAPLRGLGPKSPREAATLNTGGR